MKTIHGPVRERLKLANASDKVLAEWERVAAEEILPDEEWKGLLTFTEIWSPRSAISGDL